MTLPPTARPAGRRDPQLDRAGDVAPAGEAVRADACVDTRGGVVIRR